MSSRVRVTIGNAVVEVEAATVKEAVKALTPYYEVLGERTCGKCGSEEVGVQHRSAGGHDYYALKCFACGCQLDLGQHKEGGSLFCKRKLPSGEYDREHKGWYFWKDRQQTNQSGSDWHG